MYEERDTAANRERRRDQGLLRILSVVALAVIVIVIAVLLLRSFDDRGATTSDTGGGLVIGEVGDKPVSTRYVSLILSSGSDIGSLLRRHGLDDDAATSTGEGTFVLDAGDRQVRQLVSELRRDPAVRDAGHVYVGEASAEQSLPAPAASAGTTRGAADPSSADDTSTEMEELGEVYE